MSVIVESNMALDNFTSSNSWTTYAITQGSTPQFDYIQFDEAVPHGASGSELAELDVMTIKITNNADISTVNLHYFSLAGQFNNAYDAIIRLEQPDTTEISLHTRNISGTDSGVWQEHSAISVGSNFNADGTYIVRTRLDDATVTANSTNIFSWDRIQFEFDDGDLSDNDHAFWLGDQEESISGVWSRGLNSALDCPTRDALSTTGDTPAHNANTGRLGRMEYEIMRFNLNGATDTVDDVELDWDFQKTVDSLGAGITPEVGVEVVQPDSTAIELDSVSDPGSGCTSRTATALEANFDQDGEYMIRVYIDDNGGSDAGSTQYSVTWDNIGLTIQGAAGGAITVQKLPALGVG
jgi:hypothetical protein